MKPIVAVALGLLTLTACGAEQGDNVADPAGTASTSAAAGEQMPTAVPPPSGSVVGVGTVMDTGTPELCLGPVAESFPPQCSGIPLEGWDWKQVGSTFERSGAVRWGGYAVTGRYDGSTLTLTEAPVSSALYDPPAPVDEPFGSLCPEPAGGWQVVDREKVGYEDQDAVLAAAVQLPGFAGSAAHQFALDAGGATPGPDDASQTLVIVMVTQDVEGAERTLRPIWGGALCVIPAEHTEQELIAVQDELQALPGLLSSGAELGRLRVDVVWDDGTLQAWVDATYGGELVVVNPALRPVG